MAAHRPRHVRLGVRHGASPLRLRTALHDPSMGYRLPACQGRVETPLGQSSKHGPTAGRRSSMGPGGLELQPDRYERHYLTGRS